MYGSFDDPTGPADRASWRPLVQTVRCNMERFGTGTEIGPTNQQNRGGEGANGSAILLQNPRSSDVGDCAT